MQSYIEMSGYGFRKSLCKDATIWFLNQFLPRHQLDIQIVHRGLKRECILGCCDFIDDYKRPRCFLIELDTHMDEETYLKTLFHELTHLHQWVVGSLRLRYGKMCYCKEPVQNYEYWNRPHEIEAREQESLLYLQYLASKRGPVHEVVHYFPNRLMQAV